jgi:hypothetical protein
MRARCYEGGMKRLVWIDQIFSFFRFVVPPLARSGGPYLGTDCLVPQPFAVRGNYAVSRFLVP